MERHSIALSEVDQDCEQSGKMLKAHGSPKAIHMIPSNPQEDVSYIDIQFVSVNTIYIRVEIQGEVLGSLFVGTFLWLALQILYHQFATWFVKNYNLLTNLCWTSCYILIVNPWDLLSFEAHHWWIYKNHFVVSQIFGRSCRSAGLF